MDGSRQTTPAAGVAAPPFVPAAGAPPEETTERGEPAPPLRSGAPPPPPPPEPVTTPAAPERVAAVLARSWWTPVVVGLLLVGAGLALLGTTWSVTALARFAGALFMLRGLSLALGPARAYGSPLAELIAGVGAFVAGVVLVAWPEPTLIFLAQFAGAWLALYGVFHLVAAVAYRSVLPRWGLSAAIGGVEIVLGAVAIRRPDITLALVVAVLGVWAIVAGVVSCIVGLELRRLTADAAEAAGDG